MLEAELLALIDQGEGITVEFKKSTSEITKDVYDTVCSFSNRDGGHIFLGVRDDGVILGINPNAVEQIKKAFVTSINSAQKLYPPLYIQPEQYTVDGKIILHIYVPVNSQVCRHRGRIFDRSYESDIDITDNTDLVYQLYARKSGSYFVNKVTRFGMEHLRPDLIERARAMTSIRMANHPWKTMSDEEIMREICSNSLAHRDYSSGYVAKFVIERGRLYTENANRSHGHGTLSLSDFKPYAKNPPISKVFREISLADELGSGMRNTYKYTKLYSGGVPEFIEGDLFTTIIPLNDVAIGKVGPDVSNNLDGRTIQDTIQVTIQDKRRDELVAYCSEARTREEMQNFIGIANRSHFRKAYLNPLLESGKLKMTIPEKPSSRNQKYISAHSG